MANRVGQYHIHDAEKADPMLIENAIESLKNLGKTKIYPYGAGQICFHHRKCYFFITPYSMKWCPRHKAHQKWYKGYESIEEIFDAINGWCDYRDSFRKDK
jgi:hypothetical protein